MSGQTIYSALAALPVTVGGQTPTVYGVAAQPRTLAAAQCPARLLHLVGQTEQSSAVTVGSSPLLITRWQMTDVLLYRPAAHGTHAAPDESALLAYCDQYLAALRDQRSLTPTATLEQLTLKPGLTSLGQVDFLSVTVTLDILERG